VGEPAMTGSLKLIVRAGAGVNTIDVKAATARGIQVANCPGKNSIAVAELAFGLLLSLDRRIPDNVADLRAGKWNKKEYSKARGLYGATIGLLGTGSIAREVMTRAAAFGMPIVLWSRRFDGADRAMTAGEAKSLDLEDAARQVAIRLAPSPAEVAARSDVLSVHLALAPETKHLVNAAVLGRLKPGAFFINTARGEVVDPAALAAAVREKKLRVALDVFAQEPAAATGDFADPIVKEPGVIGTHHIGASTDQAQEAIAAEAVRIVKTFIETGRAPNAVNA
jgi:D-3-phosphoglycerate dehydrogenase